MPDSYRVVTEVRRNGDWVDIPDRASSVDVQPLGDDGRVRVTYLLPTQSVAVENEGGDPHGHTYID